MALTKAKRKALREAGFTDKDVSDLDDLLADEDNDGDGDQGEVAILRGSAAERFLASFGSDDDEDSGNGRRRGRSKDDDEDDDEDDKPRKRRWFE